MTQTKLGSAKPNDYLQLLNEKVKLTEQQFKGLYSGALTTFPSPPDHFRMRAEFRIWHDGERSYYAMYEQGQYKRPYAIHDFSIGSEAINRLMPELLEKIHAYPPLRNKLYQAEFLTTLSGDALISLIYHRPLDDDWEKYAREAQQALGVPIIGRSRKHKRVLDRDFVLETFDIDAGTFHYRQYETGFTQPNASVCQHMLNWAYAHAEQQGGDLLELYCGNGNFTLPLSKAFNRVLATEVSKLSTKAAVENMALNACTNIDLIRLSAEEVVEAMDKVRTFNRLAAIDLDSYQFSTIFVDPPRAGLDEATATFASRFETIIYISCNPDTLYTNLNFLTHTHVIEDLALFDQFPYTAHRECGVILRKKAPPTC